MHFTWRPYALLYTPAGESPGCHGHFSHHDYLGNLQPAVQPRGEIINDDAITQPDASDTPVTKGLVSDHDCDVTDAIHRYSFACVTILWVEGKQTLMLYDASPIHLTTLPLTTNGRGTYDFFPTAVLYFRLIYELYRLIHSLDFITMCTEWHEGTQEIKFIFNLWTNCTVSLFRT